MAGEPLQIEKLLPVQLLLLVSLVLQVTLFLCAGVRRIDNSGCWLRGALLWLAYNSADAVSTFTMSRLWSIGTESKHRPLVTLWAPFLLLHLAGPDNIAAYALQDNQLWLRSLLTYFSWVIIGAYFLYVNGDGSGNFLLPASWLMFGVGAIKYGERWWALRQGNLGSIRDSVKKYQSTVHSNHVHPQDVVLNDKGYLDEESHLRRAHSLIDVCKRAIVGSSEKYQDMEKMLSKVDYWTLVEMELSIMYEILYTKAAVIHTWHGYSIRVLSPLAILTSLLLYLFSGEADWHGGLVDTAVTHVLFVAALSMESISLLNTLGSSWIFAYLTSTEFSWLRYKVLCGKKWHLLRNQVVSLSRLVTCGRSRYQARRWSGNMGQYNMMHFCTRPNTLLNGRPLLGMLAELMGLEEFWNRKHFSGTVNVSDVLIRASIGQHAQKLYTMKGGLNTLGMVIRPWAMTALSRHNLEEKFKEFLGDEFQEGVIILHIATDFFLAECKSASRKGDRLAKEIKALSNYMMYLLVELPDMLPGIAQTKLYERICDALTEGVSHRPRSICGLLRSLFRYHDDPVGSNSRANDSKMLAKKLYHTHKGQKFSYGTGRLTYSAKVAEQLLEYEKEQGPVKSLELLLEVWADMLVYAGNKCSRESHAKQLGSGGELTTIAWLFLEQFHQIGLEYDRHIYIGSAHDN